MFGFVLSSFHIVFLILIATFVSTLSIRPLASFLVSVVTANVLFFVVLLFGELWINIGTLDYVCDQFGVNCRWEKRGISWSTARFFAMFSQIAINVIPVSLFWIDSRVRARNAR